MSLNRYLALALAILLIVFIIQNFRTVDVSFLFWTVTMSAAVLIMLVLVVGFVLGYIIKSVMGWSGQDRR